MMMVQDIWLSVGDYGRHSSKFTSVLAPFAAISLKFPEIHVAITGISTELIIDRQAETHPIYR